MTALSVEAVVAGYDNFAVLHATHLRVPSGSLVALLGPSGCGKTTLLRTIAGLHRATEGQIMLGEQILDGPGVRVPTHRRRITLVPQEAALFPHLDVSANIGFGIRRKPRAAERIAELLGLVGLGGLGNRAPHQLSGGQQHRVALARALAPRPDLVLLDEPFSSLDSGLREQLREDVRQLLRAESATALLVTHDQQEALSIADDVAVMSDGRILQQGTPSQLYRSPDHAWTAAFLGDATLLTAKVVDGVARTALGEITIDSGRGNTVFLRPEDVTVAERGALATVVRHSYRGHEWLVELTVEGSPVFVRWPEAGARPTIGERVHLQAPASARLVS